MGVGLSYARSERERRRARQLELERRLGLAPGEPLARALRRTALVQVDLALELLGAEQTSNGGRAAGAPDERAVHDTRKAIKRLRALLRLLEDELGQRAYTRENAALRDIAQRLSGARDAAVMLGTLDGLIQRHPRKLARRGGVRKLRARLHAEHQRAEQLTLSDPLVRAEVLGELHALRCRIAAWSLPERPGMQLVERSFQRLYRQGRARRLRAIRPKRKRDRTLAMHQWRKRVKDLRYAAEMLDRRGGDRSGGSSARLRELARRADELGELLGEEHDLAIFAERLRAGAHGKRGARGARRAHREDRRTWHTGRRTRRTLLALIAKRRRKLRRQALRQGERLYREKPSKFLRRVRAAHAAGARTAS